MARKATHPRSLHSLGAEEKPAKPESRSYYKEDEGLVIKDAKYRVTQMHYSNNPWGNYDADTAVEETTKVRLVLYEWDVAKNKAAGGDESATYADVTEEEARNIHVGDMLVVRVIIPEKGVG